MQVNVGQGPSTTCFYTHFEIYFHLFVPNLWNLPKDTLMEKAANMLKERMDLLNIKLLLKIFQKFFFQCSVFFS